MKPLALCILDDTTNNKFKKYSNCKLIEDSNKLEDSNSFFNSKKFKDIIKHLKDNKSNLHVTGLLSNNTTYSNINHLLELMDILKDNDISNIYLYLFLDGDVDDNAIENLKIVIKKMKEKNIGVLSLIAGERYMLSKDDLSNSKEIYDAMCYKIGKKYKNLKEYFKDNYKNKLVTDLFTPGIINESKVEDGDAVISFNYNNDNRVEIIDILANPDKYDIKGLRHFNNLKTLSFSEIINDNKLDIFSDLKQLWIFNDDKKIIDILGNKKYKNLEKIKLKENDKLDTVMEDISNYDLIVIQLKSIESFDSLLEKYTLMIYSSNDNKLYITAKNVKLKSGYVKLIPNTILDLLGNNINNSLICKKKKEVGKKTKIFMIVSVLLMVSLFITYLVRFIHYYKIEHPKVSVDNSLVSKIMNTKIVSNNGLTISNNDYIFKGKVKNNYVLYSGYLFRIVKINEDRTMKLVLDNPITSLVWSYETDYKKSYAKKYLEEIFINKLNNKDKYITETNWCADKVKNSDYSCKNKIKSKVGLLTLNDYYIAGSNNSYLNNGKYWWTLNTSSNNKVWYIFKEGGMNDDSINNSYGIRPSIVLKSDVAYVSGKGTEKEPYIIEDNKELNIGKYINYSGYKWKIIENNDNFKLVLSECLKENDECITHNFGSSNIYNNKYGSLGYYLNNVFYYNLDNTHLVKGTWYIGDYNEESNYDYSNIFNESFEANVGILNIVENDIEGSFTLNRSDDELIYTLDDGALYSSDPKEQLNIYPSIYIDKNIEIKSGSGTFDDPYEIGDKSE